MYVYMLYILVMHRPVQMNVLIIIPVMQREKIPFFLAPQQTQ